MRVHVKETYLSCSAWRPMDSAPFEKDVMLLVVNDVGERYPLLPPARLTEDGWVTSRTRTPLRVRPVKWCVPRSGKRQVAHA